MPTSGAQPTMTKRRGKRAKVQVAKRVTLEDAMNAINLSNRSRSPLSELITPEDTPADYVPWERHGIPYLPFAFTNTCCMCGRCGIVPDRKRVMPLGFLKVLLEEEFCRTPFVYNILYQMCTEPSLEMDQATRWQRARLSLLPSAQHQGIPMWLRGRVSICSQCFRSFQDRVMIVPGAGIPVFWGGVKAPQGVGVPSTEEAFLASMDPQYDCWTTTHGGGGAVSTPIYKKEKGRKVRREHTKMMIPLDLVIHMLYSPKSGMVPEYRMLLRVVKVMLGGECIYSRLPLEFLHTFLDQVRSGTISLGGVDGDITIGSRLHLSSYISGGQRRVSRADRDVGKVIRKCWNHLHPGGGDMGEEEEGLFGGMDVDEEDEVIASAMDNMS